ncbi:hypothetical protein pb186bvf_008101 [Paramecium bursaria]
MQDLSHSKFGYNNWEMLAMLFITGFTNLTAVPAIIIIWKQRMNFQFYISIFTVVTKSIDCPFFVMSEGGWHRLDNIGSIVCFQILFTQLGDIRDLMVENYFCYFGLFITMLCQAKDPWNLYYTVGPIVFQALLILYYVIQRGMRPKLVKRKLIKGSLILSVAILFFIKSQNEFDDYLRFHHGMWHVTIGFMSFYLWQSKLEEDFGWTDFWKKPRLNIYSYYGVANS